MEMPRAPQYCFVAKAGEACMATELRETGIPTIGQVPWGTHFLLFCETSQDVIDTLSSFFRLGLENNEFCLWLFPQQFSEQAAMDALHQAIPDLEHHIAKRSIELRPIEEWYVCDGVFEIEKAIERWKGKVNDALAKGYAGLRGFGNPDRLLVEHPQSLAEFEKEFEKWIAERRMVVGCAYPLALMSAIQIFDVAAAHQFVTARRRGVWQTLETPELMQAKAEIERLNEELGARVVERTQELDAVNHDLRTEIAKRQRTLEALRQSEERFSKAFHSSPAPIGIFRFSDGRMLDVNDAFARMVGYTRTELIGQTALGLGFWVNPAEREELIRMLSEGRAVRDQERQLRARSGRIFNVLVFMEFIELAGETCVLVTDYDITERKQAEDALRKSESNFRTLADKSPQAISIYQHHKMVYANPARSALLGYTIEELTSMSRDEVIALSYPLDRAVAAERARKRDAGEEVSPSFESRVVRKDGSIRWIQSFNNAIEYNGQPAILATSLDITERKQAEEAVQESHQLLRTVLETLPVGVSVVDKAGDILLVNGAFKRTWGGMIINGRERWAQTKAYWHDSGKRIAPTSWASIRALSEGQTSLNELIDIETYDGRQKTIHNSVAPIRNAGGLIAGAVIVNEDVTDRVRAEEAIRKSERVLREAEFLGGTGSWEQDLVTGETFNSESNLHLFFGNDRTKGAHFEDFVQAVHPDDREFWLRSRSKLLKGEPADLEFRVVWPDGSVHVIFRRPGVVRDESGKVVRLYGTNVDITERKRTEEALRKSERILREAESLGGTGSWEQDLVTGEIFNSESNLRLFFGDDQSKGADLEDYLQVVHPDDREYVLRRREQLVSEGGAGDIEYRVVWPDGSVHVIFGLATVIRGESGKTIRVFGTNVDITERKRAEEENKRQAARAETLSRIAAQLNKKLDLDTVVRAVCQEVVDTFQGSQATMNLYDPRSDQLVYAGGVNIPPEYASKMEPVGRIQFEEFVRTMGPIIVVPDIQALPIVPNPEFSAHMDVRTVVTVDVRRDQELIGVLAFGVNGHVREFTEDELTLLKAISDLAAQAIANAQLLRTANEQREQLRSLSAKLVAAQEAERRTIARELHDEIGQVLNAVNANLHALQLSPNRATRSKRLEESIGLVDDALLRIRDLSLDLRPSLLDDFGLVAALEWYLEHEAERSGFTVEFTAEPREMRFSPDLETTVFRVAQIALTNVTRHARAHRVHGELRQDDGALVLAIRDDGVGFDVQKALEGASRGATLGLASVQERVRLAGGRVKIESAPGRGTEVNVRFPIHRQ